MASKDSRKIERTVFVGHAFYSPGQEDALAAAGMTEADVADLTERGALSGSWSAAPAEPDAEAEPAKSEPAKAAKSGKGAKSA